MRRRLKGRDHMKRINLNNREPINPDDPSYATLLQNLQGNILNDNGRHYEQLILVRFPNDQESGRLWVRRFAEEITSAKKHRTVAKLRNERLEILKEEMKNAGVTYPDDMWKPEWEKRWKALYKEKPFVAFYLSAQGYRTLGVPESQIPHDFAFQRGMKAAQERLRDDHGQWELHYLDEPGFDALILFAHDDEDALRNMMLEHEKQLIRIGATTKAEETGAALYSGPRVERAQPREHYGFRDGISNPLFLATDYCHDLKRPPLQSAPTACERADEGMKKWDPFAPLGLVLVEEPGGAPDRCGSYLVLRKLEQNVKLFRIEIERLATRLQGAGTVSRAEAMAMGRFRDGMPIVSGESPDKSPIHYNHFNYEDNIGRCPFHAHILKANPRRDRSRDADVNPASDRWRRIARRGITYGERTQNPDGSTNFDDLPTKPVGLFFMCYQRDIMHQFEFIQQSWLNYMNPGIGLDPIAGQGDGVHRPQRWPDTYGGVPNVELDLRKTVTLRGGEYFFAPSIPFLKAL